MKFSEKNHETLIKAFFDVHRLLYIDYCDYKYQEKFISGNIRKKFLSKFNIFLSGIFQKNGRYY